MFRFDITKYFIDKDSGIEEIDGLSDSEFRMRINKVNNKFEKNLISESEMEKYVLNRDKFVYKIECAQAGITPYDARNNIYIYFKTYYYIADEDIVKILRGTM